MSVSRLLVGASLIGAVFVWWFAAGSHFAAVVDRITTTSDGTASSPIEFVFDEANDATSEPAAFTFSSRRRSIGRDWRIVERPDSRVSLETSRGRIVLGAVTCRSSTNRGQRIYTFAPEPGDSISLTRRRSRVPWPRPFVVSWLGGRLPFWSRYVYDRLVWKKANGDMLDVVWRDEQRLEPSSGWMDQYQSAVPTTSLRTAKR